MEYYAINIVEKVLNGTKCQRIKGVCSLEHASRRANNMEHTLFQYSNELMT